MEDATKEIIKEVKASVNEPRFQKRKVMVRLTKRKIEASQEVDGVFLYRLRKYKCLGLRREILLCSMENIQDTKEGAIYLAFFYVSEPLLARKSWTITPFGNALKFYKIKKAR